MSAGRFLKLEGLAFGFAGAARTLEGIDLVLAPGEIHGILGRSGCGKTTLLKLAAGLLAPQAGRVCVRGRSPQAAREDIGFMFQQPTLLEWLSALDNVLLPVSLQRTPSHSERAWALQLLEQLGLAGLEARRPGQISGGQQSRVALARALVLRPSLLLLDEPFAALDALTREALHQAGLSEADVTIVVTGLLNFAPLMQGQVDATAATDTGLLVGRRRGLPDVNVMEVARSLNVSSDLYVVREEVYQSKKDLLRRFLRAYRDAAAWMITSPEEAARLAVKRAIDGSDPALNLDVIRLRNTATVSPLTQRLGLGAMDLPSLQAAADAYRKLGLIERPIRMADVVASDLLPGK